MEPSGSTRATSAAGFSEVVKIGTGWGSFASISGSGDVDDDGRADLLAWSAASG
jgi:hypothetical protein